MILLNKSLVICVIVLLFSDVFCCERQFGITCVTFARHGQCGSADVSSVGFRVFIVEVGFGGGGRLDVYHNKLSVFASTSVIMQLASHNNSEVVSLAFLFCQKMQLTDSRVLTRLTICLFSILCLAVKNRTSVISLCYAHECSVL